MEYDPNLYELLLEKVATYIEMRTQRDERPRRRPTLDILHDEETAYAALKSVYEQLINSRQREAGK